MFDHIKGEIIGPGECPDRQGEKGGDVPPRGRQEDQAARRKTDHDEADGFDQHPARIREITPDRDMTIVYRLSATRVIGMLNAHFDRQIAVSLRSPLRHVGPLRSSHRLLCRMAYPRKPQLPFAFELSRSELF